MAKLSRRQAGILQNFANQLAQMSVGWELLINQSGSFVGQPAQGTIHIDALSGTPTLNGLGTELGMAMYMRSWLVGEIGRQRLSPDWLHSAEADIHYAIRSPDWIETGSTVDLESHVEVATGWGAAHAEFRNTQFLMRNTTSA